MRITYRDQNNKNYWAKRWKDIPADDAMEDINKYPLKYALLTVKDKNQKILEAGCGAGRILRYFKNRGYSITGIDFIKCVVSKLKKTDPSLDVHVGDITNLHYDDKTFKYVLAFGLYHNLPPELLDKALSETNRVMTKGGIVCASFRADNIQTKLTDWLAESRNNVSCNVKKKEFHKLNLSNKEFKQLFIKNGFIVSELFFVENMPILYKFKTFRSKKHKIFNEFIARRDGYKLSILGAFLQKIIMIFFPSQFCNINVIIATKQ